MNRSSSRRAAAPRTFGVLVLAMVFTSVLAPSASAQLGDLGGGGIADPVSGVTVPLPGGDKAPEADKAGGVVGVVTDPIAGVAPGGKDETSGPIEDITEAVNEAVDKSKEAADDAAGNAGNTVGDIGAGVAGTVGGIKDSINKTTDGLSGRDKKKKGHHKPRDRKGRAHGRDRSTAPGGAQSPHVLGNTLADAMAADAKTIAAPAQDIQVTATPAHESAASQIARVLSEVADPAKAVFPAMLIALVVAFLMVQNRIDSKDPKLALAPVDSEHDLLSFT